MSINDIEEKEYYIEEGHSGISLVILINFLLDFI